VRPLRLLISGGLLQTRATCRGMGVCCRPGGRSRMLALPPAIPSCVRRVPLLFLAGSAHWEVLLRARAIETQCYVAAAAQVGRHNDKRTTYGHAMIIDPWGTVLAQCSDATSPGLAVAEVDLAYLRDVRTRMPVRAHQRPDVYASAPIVTPMLAEDGAEARAPLQGGGQQTK